MSTGNSLPRSRCSYLGIALLFTIILLPTSMATVLVTLSNLNPPSHHDAIPAGHPERWIPVATN